MLYTAASRVKELKNFMVVTNAGYSRDWHIRTNMFHTVLDGDREVLYDEDCKVYATLFKDLPRFWKVDLRMLFNKVEPFFLEHRGWPNAARAARHKLTLGAKRRATAAVDATIHGAGADSRYGKKEDKPPFWVVAVDYLHQQIAGVKPIDDDWYQ